LYFKTGSIALALFIGDRKGLDHSEMDLKPDLGEKKPQARDDTGILVVHANR